MRADVEALSAIERRVTSGDRESADWLVGRLRELGAEDIRVETFRCHSHWLIPHGAHQALAILAALKGGLLGRLLAMGAAASYEADYTGRYQGLRNVLPGAGSGHNVVARVGEGRRTLVLVAHHDAAVTGWVWDPRFLEGGRNFARRTGTTPSFIGLPLAAMGLIALGPRRIGAALLGLGLLLGAQAAASETVPGASDNATGVAGVLELARGLVAEPLEDTQVILLFPSGEEVGLVGMLAWLRENRDRLDPETTLVLGLDTLGAGQPVVARGESFTGRYRHEDLELAGDVQRIVLGAGTDPMAARYAGLPSVSILSWSDGGFTNYHQPTDTPDRVNWESVGGCLDLAGRILERWQASR